MTEQPTFECYTEHASKNYGLNALRFFDADGNVFWFSYKTLVAFKKAGNPYSKTIRENVWGPTTGKHLNAIDRDKSKRVDLDTFNRLYDELFGENHG